MLIKTARKNFDVTGVTFSTGQSDPQMAWQSLIPLTYSLSRVADTPKAKPAAGQKDVLPAVDPLTYRLRIMTTMNVNDTKWGEFVIKTNVPEKPEVKVTGSVGP